MNKKKDSVAKGGSSLVIARLFGMGLSFVLFLVLARHSAEDAGFFRTVATYILMSEFLGMLGLQRWLSTEIVPETPQRWPIFLAATTFTLASSTALALIYVAIALSGAYSPALNQGILLGALAVIPSGVLSCVQSTVVGIGNSHTLGKLALIENLVRCGISILFVYLQHPVMYIVVVFVLCRWAIALLGLRHITQILHADTWTPQMALVKEVARQAPRFATIIFAFVLLKNAGLVLLPALYNEREAAIFAVGYQLLDMILIIPSVLAMVSNNMFVTKASQSNASLKKASTQLVSITSLALFPLAAVTAGFAQNFLLFLYGDHYLVAKNSLILLMLASCLMMIDQVLSQVMLAKKDYRSDMRSILVGGISAVMLTAALSDFYGATGASAALCLAVLLTVAVRLVMLKNIFSIQLLWISIWRPIIASVAVLLLCLLWFRLPLFSTWALSKYQWMLCVPLVLIVYAWLIYLLGGMNLAKRKRLRNFLFHHH
jgi:O-antigen/teichoic acid export membrane protein